MADDIEGDLYYVRDRTATNFFKTPVRKLKGIRRPVLNVLEELLGWFNFYTIIYENNILFNLVIWEGWMGESSGCLHCCLFSYPLESIDSCSLFAGLTPLGQYASFSSPESHSIYCPAHHSQNMKIHLLSTTSPRIPPWWALHSEWSSVDHFQHKINQLFLK